MPDYRHMASREWVATRKVEASKVLTVNIKGTCGGALGPAAPAQAKLPIL
ncbi:hypothetical protein COLO4_16061 [Corchorus olitorius]|uniref:Uncharacterized protein n=1 Tax=Corchorus olitorius TaxID=93759 RepID=A0A1R3JJT3_9ROSI|nr:hypothetical protein COLO4_16061 [Corchorus olitorius]